MYVCIPYYATTNIFLFASLFIAFQVASKKTFYKYGTYITKYFNITATCLKHISYSIIYGQNYPVPISVAHQTVEMSRLILK